MAEQSKSLPTLMAEATQTLQSELAPRVARLMRPVLGNVPVSKAERRRRWWQEEDGWTPEHERMLLTAQYPDGSPILDANGRPKKPLSPEDVGLLKYKYREVDARAAGSGDVRKEAQYAREMTDLGPPPPDPLEAAAQQASPPEPAPSAAPAPQPAPMSAPSVPPQGGY